MEQDNVAPEFDAVLFESQASGDDGGAAQGRNAHALAAQVLRSLDAAIAVHVEVSVAKVARREERDGDVALVTARQQVGVGRERHLRGAELVVLGHAPKQLKRPERDEAQGHARWLRCPVE